MGGDIELLNSTIKTYLNAPSMVPDYEDIIDPYMDNAMGFKQVEADAEKMAEDNPDIDKEQVKKLIADEKAKYKEQMKGGAVEKEIQKKLDELKGHFAEVKQSSTDVGKEVAKATTDAAIPTMITPGAPNPMHSAIVLIIMSLSVKKAIDSCLRSSSKAINIIDELGLSQTPMAANLAALMAPLIAIKAKAAQVEAENEAASADCPPSSEGEVDPSYTYTLSTGEVVNAEQIVDWADEQALTVPVEDGSEGAQVLSVLLASSNYEVKAWANAVKEYSTYLKNKG
jgi:hypothetical protein